jgi:hypothetical protein
MKHVISSISRRLFTNEKKWFLVGLVALLWIVAVNAFPSSAIFSLGDITMPIHTSERFDEYMTEYQWRGLPYFGVFFFLDAVGLPHGSQLTAYLALFLFGSYFSAYTALRMMFRNASHISTAAFSFVYAVNPYTLSLLLFGGMFSSLSLLYIILPVWVAFLQKFLHNPSLRTGGVAVVLAFVASAAFVSPKFVLALPLVGGIGAVVSMMFEKKKLTLRTIYASILLGFAIVAVWAYAIPSAAIMIRFGESDAISESVSTVQNRFVEHSQPITNSLRFPTADSFAESFPQWFPYNQWHWAAPIFSGLTIIPIGWLLFGWMTQRRSRCDQVRRIFWTSSTLLAILAFLSAGAIAPFSFLNEKLFALPGFGAMFSAETFAIWIPFCLTLIGFSVAMLMPKYTKVFALSAIAVSFSTLPFFVGQLHRSTSPVLGESFQKNIWETASTSALIALPEAHASFCSWLSENGEPGLVAQLPHSVRGDALVWEHIPSLGLFSRNIFDEVWGRETLSPNVPYFDRWLFAKTFVSSEESPEWLPILLGSAGVRYVAIHGDSSEGIPEEFRAKIEYLERIGELTFVFGGEGLFVYEIRSERVFPDVFISDALPVLTERPSGILAASDTLLTTPTRSVSCEHLSRECSVRLLEEDGGKRLTITKPFFVHWKAGVVKSDGSELPLQAIRSTGWFVGWDIPVVSSGDTITIEHTRCRWDMFGLIISLFALLCASMAILFPKSKRNDV